MHANTSIGTQSQQPRLKYSPIYGRTLLIAALASVAALTLAAAHVHQAGQDSQEKSATATTLTMRDVARMAVEKNGNYLSSIDSYNAARQSVIQSFAAFLPTITPNYTYTSQRSSTYFAGNTVFSQTEGGTAGINANWQILDLGNREFQLQSARHSAESAKANALQTLRQTIFTAENQYYETLRAQELKKVSEAQVKRAQAIYDQTKLNIEKGGAAKVAIYQVEADLDNAQVALLQSQNSISTNSALLKSTIGYPTERLLPELVPLKTPTENLALPKLQDLLEEGVKSRPDLLALRENIDSLDANRRLQNLNASLNLSLNATFNETLMPHTLQDRIFSLTASYPLFDGGASRAAARSASYVEDSAKHSYEQAVRAAKAAIESDYLTYTQNAQRLAAASKADNAATINYQDVYQSYLLGSSSLLDVLTAQVSQVTAESNLIQAVYDFAESELSLRLDTGRPLPDQTAANLP